MNLVLTLPYSIVHVHINNINVYLRSKVHLCISWLVKVCICAKMALTCCIEAAYLDQGLPPGARGSRKVASSAASGVSPSGDAPAAKRNTYIQMARAPVVEYRYADHLI